MGFEYLFNFFSGLLNCVFNLVPLSFLPVSHSVSLITTAHHKGYMLPADLLKVGGASMLRNIVKLQGQQ